MYTIETFETGLNYLGITDPETIVEIWKNTQTNKEDDRKIKSSLERYEAYKTRGEVPKGLSKKELTALLKETQKTIDEYRAIIRERGSEFLEMVLEDTWIPKKVKIKKLIEFSSLKNKKELDITHARSYPIEELLHFNRAGFVSCPFHGPEKTPSMKWYPKRNKAHCFSCGVDVDPIDVYRQIHSVDFINAVKALSPIME